MADTERLEAKGPRGEACIIIRTWAASAASDRGATAGERRQPSYRLATGERLGGSIQLDATLRLRASRGGPAR